MSETFADDYLSVPAAAKLLGVSASTIWRWIAAHKLPAYRIGLRRIRVKREDLKAVIRPAEMKEGAEPDGKPRDIWAGYDPARVIEALRASAGALAGVDREALIAEIYAARGQSSSGRPG